MKKGFQVFFVLTAMVLLFACKSGKDAGLASKETTRKTLTEPERINFTYHFFNGNKEKMLGNYEQAAANFLQCFKIDNTDPAPMYELAFLYSFQGKKQEALAFSKRAAELAPRNLWYQQLYADILEDNSRFQEAAEVYKRVIETHPERLDIYYKLAETYIYSHKWNDAAKIYDRIEGMIGVNEETSLQKIRLYKETQKREKAIAEAQKLVQAFPKEEKYYGILGGLYLENNRKDKAFETYTSYLKIDPENALIRLSLADYYHAVGEDEKAFNEIKTAFKNPELDVDTKMKILLNYYNFTETNLPPEVSGQQAGGKFRNEADELCKILIDVHPKDSRSYAIYGDFLYRDKKLEEARKSYRTAIELDSSRYPLWNQVLIINSELNDYESLLKESKSAIDLFPTQPVAYLLNGLANIQLGKNEEAIEVLNQGINYVVKNDLLMSQFYSNIGDTYNKLKNYAASDEAYEKALQFDPKNMYVLNNYSYYLSLRKENLEKAEEMSKRSNELDPKNGSFQDTYAWVLYQIGKYDEARKWIERSIENGGKNAVILEHYGDILYKLGETEKAYQQWVDAKDKGTGSEFLEKKIADKKLYE